MTLLQTIGCCWQPCVRRSPSRRSKVKSSSSEKRSRRRPSDTSSISSGGGGTSGGGVAGGGGGGGAGGGGGSTHRRRTGLSSFVSRPGPGADAKQLVRQITAALNGDATARLQQTLAGAAAAGTDPSELGELLSSMGALQSACARGSAAAAAVLIRHGAAVNALLKSDGGTVGSAAAAGATASEHDSAPLHVAVRRRHLGVASLLLSHGANVNVLTRFERRTPLHVAAAPISGAVSAAANAGDDDHNSVALICFLVENGARVDQGDIYGTTPLHIAARTGRLAAIGALLDCRADINAYDNEGWTALHLAAAGGDMRVVRFLVDRQAHVDCQNRYGRTPLHWACSARHLAVVRLLLDNRASVVATDRYGKTALVHADGDDEIRAVVRAAMPAEAVAASRDLESGTLRSNASTIGLYVNIDGRRRRQQRRRDEQPLRSSCLSSSLTVTSMSSYVFGDSLSLRFDENIDNNNDTLKLDGSSTRSFENAEVDHSDFAMMTTPCGATRNHRRRNDDVGERRNGDDAADSTVKIDRTVVARTADGERCSADGFSRRSSSSRVSQNSSSPAGKTPAKPHSFDGANDVQTVSNLDDDDDSRAASMKRKLFRVAKDCSEALVDGSETAMKSSLLTTLQVVRNLQSHLGELAASSNAGSSSLVDERKDSTARKSATLGRVGCDSFTGSSLSDKLRQASHSVCTF